MPDNIHHLPPRITESEAKELLLDSYVMYIHTHTCTNCECGERFSELFEVWAHPTKTRTTALNVLRPATRLDHSLQLAYIELPERPIPVCSDCAPTYDIGASPPIPALSREEWAATLKRKYAPPAASQPKKPAPPTLDQL
jgi:hypothetical protein